MAVVNRNAPLELRFDRSAVDSVANQRELVAVGRTGEGPPVVMHVNRIATDHIRGSIQRSEPRPAEIPEERVPDVGIGDVQIDHMTSGAGCTLGTDDHVST